jgi:hypothetical protein
VEEREMKSCLRVGGGQYSIFLFNSITVVCASSSPRCRIRASGSYAHAPRTVEVARPLARGRARAAGATYPSPGPHPQATRVACLHVWLCPRVGGRVPSRRVRAPTRRAAPSRWEAAHLRSHAPRRRGVTRLSPRPSCKAME